MEDDIADAAAANPRVYATSRVRLAFCQWAFFYEGVEGPD
jgi:hypothetical protein